MKNYVLAHDLGTSGNKASLYDREGRMVSSAFHGYSTQYARTGWAEQDADFHLGANEPTRLAGATQTQIVPPGPQISQRRLDQARRAALPDLS